MRRSKFNEKQAYIEEDEDEESKSRRKSDSCNSKRPWTREVSLSTLKRPYGRFPTLLLFAVIYTGK
jgi:hypothetical protein